jgi:hypothetical protein
VWRGDRWQRAPDHMKSSHDLQFWAPLRWDDTKSPPVLHRLESGLMGSSWTLLDASS